MYIVERYINRGWNSVNNPNSPKVVSGQGGRKLRVREASGEHGDRSSQLRPLPMLRSR
jgi:hypothetical protein